MSDDTIIWATVKSVIVPKLEGQGEGERSREVGESKV